MRRNPSQVTLAEVLIFLKIVPRLLENSRIIWRFRQFLVYSPLFSIFGLDRGRRVLGVFKVSGDELSHAVIRGVHVLLFVRQFIRRRQIADGLTRSEQRQQIRRKKLRHGGLDPSIRYKGRRRRRAWRSID